MSTRGTYRFSEPHQGIPAVTIYIHCDNYPEGAALWFYKLLTNPSKGGMATQFIRAVDAAELTISHDAHGDTEYKYDIEGRGPNATLICKKRNWSEDERWDGHYVGALCEFVRQNSKMIEDFQPFKSVKLPYDRVVHLNSITAKLQLDSRTGPLHHLSAWRQHGSQRPGSANWDSRAGEARAILEAFPELATAESDELLALKQE